MKRLILAIVTLSMLFSVAPVYASVQENAESSMQTDDSETPMLFDSDIPVLSITLSEDGVSTEKYNACTVTLYDPSGNYETIYDDAAKVKIRGHSTSAGEKSPYNIKFNKKQDVLGMGLCKKWSLLANMYDKTQLRNKLAYTLADDIGMAYVQQSAYVDVYVNGEYRGLYLLCESIGVGESRVNLNTDQFEYLLECEPYYYYSNDYWIRTPLCGILLGYNEPDPPTDAQRHWLVSFMYRMENALLSGNYERVKEVVDVQSFADAYIVQEFFKQVDYSTSSTRFYIQDGKIYEGPVWDFDLSSGNCSAEVYPAYNRVDESGNSFEGLHCTGLWNSYLFQYEEFRFLLRERFYELSPYLINVFAENELGISQIDCLLQTYRESIDRNYTVWSTEETYSAFERTPTDGTFDAEIAYLRSWFSNRYDWLYGCFVTEYASRLQER